MKTSEKKEDKIQLVKIDQLDVKNLEEFKGAETQQMELVKNHPFVEIEDTKTYEVAKKNRTALVKGRTSIEKQDKLIASKIKTLREHIMERRDYLINITKEAEEKQQEEVKRWEAIKEEERLEKIRLEEERLDNLKAELEADYKELISHVSKMEKLEEAEAIEKKIETFQEEKREKYESDFLLLFEERIDSAFVALNGRKQEIQKELEFEKRQAELKAEQEKTERRNKLYKYQDFLSKDIEEVVSFDEEDFEKALQSAKAKFEKKQEADKASEAKRQAEIAAKEDAIRKEQEAIDKKKREQEEAEKAQSVFASRTKRLNEELGLKFNFVDAFVHPEDEGLSITVDNIKSMDDDSFDEFIKGAIQYMTPEEEPEEVEETKETEEPVKDNPDEPWQEIIDVHKSQVEHLLNSVSKNRINPTKTNANALIEFCNCVEEAYNDLIKIVD